MDEKAYGIIPLKKTAQGWQVLLVHSAHQFWGIPKGHAEKGETPVAAAKRELLEETHLNIVRFIFPTPFHENYSFKKGDKLVDKEVIYFMAEVEGDVVIQEKEILASQWLSFDDALSVATYPETRKVLTEAMQMIQMEKI